jgi:hypothetical protein
MRLNGRLDTTKGADLVAIKRAALRDATKRAEVGILGILGAQWLVKCDQTGTLGMRFAAVSGLSRLGDCDQTGGVCHGLGPETG